MNDILIIGGGAAGLAAAISAADADPSASILILEGLDRVGKKLLATGNGKCNLSNRHMGPEHYHTAAPERLERWLEDMPTRETLDFFRALGLACMEDEAGRIYPYARQASMVVDTLLLALHRRPNIRIRCGCRVTGLARSKGRFTVTAGEETHLARQVILTTGGRAAPRQGSDGSGYALASALGHSCTPLAPALVPLRCRGSWFKTLKGLRVLAAASLYRGRQLLGREEGEVQFTDYGISGIPTFQLSCLLTAENDIVLDLVPEQGFEALRSDFRRRAKEHPDECAEEALLGLLPKRLQFVLLREAGIDPAQRAGSLTRQQLDELAGKYKRWRFPVTGTQGYENAQVTLGGIALDEVEQDFSSRRAPGLYLAGEVLDVTGDCGGYNLHWAWCSGRAAGSAAVRDRRQR